MAIKATQSRRSGAHLRTRAYLALQRSPRSTQNPLACIRLASFKHPLAGQSAASQTVNEVDNSVYYFNMTGPGPPPTDVGAAGDIFLDIGPSGAVYARTSPSEWVLWQCSSTDIGPLLVHPDFDDVYLWMDKNRLCWRFCPGGFGLAETAAPVKVYNAVQATLALSRDEYCRKLYVDDVAGSSKRTFSREFAYEASQSAVPKRPRLTDQSTAAGMDAIEAEAQERVGREFPELPKRGREIVVQQLLLACETAADTRSKDVALNDAHQAIRDVEMERNTARGNSNRAEAAHAEVQVEHAAVVVQRDEAQDVARRQHVQIVEVNQKENVYKALIETLRQDVAKTKCNANERIAAMVRSAREKDERISNIDIELALARDLRESADEENESLGKDLHERDLELASTKACLVQTELELEQNEESVYQMGAALCRTQTTLRQTKTTLRETEVTLSTTETALSQTQDVLRLTELDAQNYLDEARDLKTVRAAKNGEIRQLKAQLGERDHEAHAANARVNGLEERLARMTAERDIATAKYDEVVEYL